jgi:hypothetical protein
MWIIIDDPWHSVLLMSIMVLFQAFQIANLIREYTEVLQQSPQQVRRRDNNAKKRSGNTSRPVSILHKPVPVIDSVAS